jgi:hypothetical protein
MICPIRPPGSFAPLWSGLSSWSGLSRRRPNRLITGSTVYVVLADPPGQRLDRVAEPRPLLPSPGAADALVPADSHHAPSKPSVLTRTYNSARLVAVAMSDRLARIGHPSIDMIAGQGL